MLHRRTILTGAAAVLPALPLLGSRAARAVPPFICDTH